MPLSGKDGCDLAAPDFFDLGKDSDLVVDEDIVIGREAAFYVVQLFLFVNVDEHVAMDRLGDSRALDLQRLEDHVAIRKDGGRTPLLDVLDGIERIGIKPRGERI